MKVNDFWLSFLVVTVIRDCLIQMLFFDISPLFHIFSPTLKGQWWLLLFLMWNNWLFIILRFSQTKFLIFLPPPLPNFSRPWDIMDKRPSSIISTHDATVSWISIQIYFFVFLKLFENYENHFGMFQLLDSPLS